MDSIQIVVIGEDSIKFVHIGALFIVLYVLPICI